MNTTEMTSELASRTFFPHIINECVGLWDYFFGSVETESIGNGNSPQQARDLNSDSAAAKKRVEDRDNGIVGYMTYTDTKGNSQTFKLTEAGWDAFAAFNNPGYARVGAQFEEFLSNYTSDIFNPSGLSFDLNSIIDQFIKQNNIMDLPKEAIISGYVQQMSKKFSKNVSITKL